MVKMGVHAIFDEAHYTVPKSQAPMAAQALQCLGYAKPNDIFKDGKFVCTNTIDIKLNHPSAIEPTRLNETSNILQIYSSSPSTTLLPGEETYINTNAILKPPINGYLQIKNTNSVSGLQVKDQVIYHDNTEELIVEVVNTTTRDMSIPQGSCIANAMHNTVKDIDI